MQLVLKRLYIVRKARPESVKIFLFHAPGFQLAEIRVRSPEALRVRDCGLSVLTVSARTVVGQSARYDHDVVIDVSPLLLGDFGIFVAVFGIIPVADELLDSVQLAELFSCNRKDFHAVIKRYLGAGGEPDRKIVKHVLTYFVYQFGGFVFEYFVQAKIAVKFEVVRKNRECRFLFTFFFCDLEIQFLNVREETFDRPAALYMCRIGLRFDRYDSPSANKGTRELPVELVILSVDAHAGRLEVRYKFHFDTIPFLSEIKTGRAGSAPPGENLPVNQVSGVTFRHSYLKLQLLGFSPVNHGVDRFVIDFLFHFSDSGFLVDIVVNIKVVSQNVDLLNDPVDFFKCVLIFRG